MKKSVSGLNFLLFSAFIEGSALMAVEIISSKLIAPYYGTSLYVWASVIAITMGGLAIGYFSGGSLSEKRINTMGKLMLLFTLASFFVFVMPHLSGLIMEETMSLEIRAGIFLSCCVFMLPPVICFGIVSPVVIRLYVKNAERVGYSAGMVYTISTTGGILFTFLTGFYLITAVGICSSAHIVGLIVGIPPLIYYIRILFSRIKKVAPHEK